MRGGRTHRDARAHHADGRQRIDVGVDAAAGGDDVVGVLRQHAAERDVVDVAVRKRLPVHQLLRVVQLDPPGATRDGVGGPIARRMSSSVELAAAHDPAGLADAGVAVVRTRAFAKIFGNSVRRNLMTASAWRRPSNTMRPVCERVERRLEVRDVREHEVLAGEVHQEAVVAHEPVRRAALAPAARGRLVITSLLRRRSCRSLR